MDPESEVFRAWFFRLTGAFVVAVLAVMGTLLWQPQGKPGLPPSSLVVGLQGPPSVLNRLFTQRLQQQFPPGTLEAAMAAELTRQGFQQQDWLYPSLGHVALRTESNFPCVRSARVFWTDNKAFRVVEVHGEYQRACP